jgi:3-hydroxyisobutyrate dehydrogenase/glyoxylate/succinic semialdehyde reductase
MNIGFLGLGIMGSRMAANLINAGHTLTVWNRSAEKAAPLQALGARVAASPADAAMGNEVVISMLSNPEAVERTALGENGFLGQMTAGSLWMDSSTVNPTFTRRMAEEAQQQQVRFVDAPVSGSKEAAAKGQLLFMVGAAEEDLTLLRPLLEVMGRGVVHVGPVGMGASLKMVNNMMVAEAYLAFSEGMLLAEALGITRERFFEIFSGPSAAIVAPLVMGKRAKIETGDFEADFPLQWMQKDLHLASLTAYEHGLALPSANAAKEVFMLAARSGLGEEDFSAVIKFLSQQPSNGS